MEERERDSLTKTGQIAYQDIFDVRGGGASRVVIVRGPRLGDLVEIASSPVTVGRDPANQLVLEEAGVSREHAVIRPTPEGVFVEDLGSTNGTFVNHQSVSEQRLQDGDLIGIGTTTLKFLSEDNVEQAYYRYLHEVSVRDPLTGIPNRRYFDDVLYREIARVRRYGRHLSLLIIDIDHFKKVNDTWGHLCGDCVLRELPALVEPLLRRSESFSRFGGEEFGVIVPETDTRGAEILAERIRLAVETHSFPWGQETIHVTVSLGVASWTEDMHSAADLIQVADACLYRAKRKGRNRVCIPKRSMRKR